MNRHQKRQRRAAKSLAAQQSQKISQKTPKFWSVFWTIIGVVAFLAFTSYTGFFAPDLYMYIIFGIVIVLLNIYLFYLSFKDEDIEQK